MTNFSSGDENIYRRICRYKNVDKNCYRQKILPFLKFSETCLKHSFSLKWQKNIDHPYIFSIHILRHKLQKLTLSHATFPGVKRNNQWYEKKALRNGITWDSLPLPITLHNKIHCPLSPLDRYVMVEWCLIPGLQWTNKNLFNSLQYFIKMTLKLRKTALNCKNIESQTITTEYLTA